MDPQPFDLPLAESPVFLVVPTYQLAAKVSGC